MIGQNERRRLFGESQEKINEKVKQAWDCGLNLVYCCGETTEQKDSEQTEACIGAQLAVLTTIDVDWSKTVIVYEPLWAMGTEIIASAD